MEADDRVIGEIGYNAGSEKFYKSGAAVRLDQLIEMLAAKY